MGGMLRNHLSSGVVKRVTTGSLGLEHIHDRLRATGAKDGLGAGLVVEGGLGGKGSQPLGLALTGEGWACNGDILFFGKRLVVRGGATLHGPRTKSGSLSLFFMALCCGHVGE
jgi:hypothetical protein